MNQRIFQIQITIDKFNGLFRFKFCSLKLKKKIHKKFSQHIHSHTHSFKHNNKTATLITSLLEL